jgi:transcription initiation factor TFIIE subunit alpha
MKITKEVLDELVVALIGGDILPLVDILNNKKNVSEFKLAEKLNITVNQTRNMLYRLNEYNLVSFMRKKDKKKGWYIYYWTLNLKSAWNALQKLRAKQLKDFKVRLLREENGIFYVCPMGCMRLKMETAMDHDFKCQECGALLRVQDNQKTIDNIQKRIKTLESELEEAREEIEITKKKIRRKLAAREAKKAREELKKKQAKKVKKKKVKKKKVAKKKVKKKVAKKVKKKKVIKKKVTKKKVTKKKVTKKKTVKKKVVKKTKKKVVKKKKK